MRSVWPRGLGSYLLRHPSNAPALVRAGWLLRARGWWRHAPFLPLPDPAYWSFRRSTANGPYGEITVDAMIAAAQWSIRQHARR